MLLSCFDTRIEYMQQRLWPAEPRIFTSWPLLKRLARPFPTQSSPCLFLCLAITCLIPYVPTPLRSFSFSNLPRSFPFKGLCICCFLDLKHPFIRMFPIVSSSSLRSLLKCHLLQGTLLECLRLSGPLCYHPSHSPTVLPVSATPSLPDIIFVICVFASSN